MTPTKSMILAMRCTRASGWVSSEVATGGAATRAKSGAFAAEVGPRVLALQQGGTNLQGIADDLTAAGSAMLRAGSGWSENSVKNFAQRWRRIIRATRQAAAPAGRPGVTNSHKGIEEALIWRRAGRLTAAIAALLMVAFARSSAAQNGGDLTLGRHLAEQWCSDCHVVGPAAQQGSSSGAPTFAAVARMSSTTLMSLRAFLQSPHPPMPDLRLSHGQIDDVAAYILSLRQTK